MRTDSDRQRAQRKNHIGAYFWRASKLQKRMYSIADQFVTTGFAAVYVEPEVVAQCPMIRYFESIGSYYELDREGETYVFAHSDMHSIDELTAKYGADPMVRMGIVTNAEGKQDPGTTLLEVVQWFDKTNVTLFLPAREGLVLSSYAHKLDECPVKIIERPGYSRKNPRGQFDDVIWVQAARAVIGLLSLKAAAKMVNAPTQMPKDVDILPIGPDTLLQTDGIVKTVDLGINPQVFAQSATLDSELRLGSGYPDARTGELQASVITGKGVEALLGTFDSEVRGDQMVFQEGLQEVTEMCFEMDEKWWPDVTKTVSGVDTNGSYEFTYQASSHAGRWEVQLTYGFMTGLKPAQAIVSALQLAGAGWVTRKTGLSNLPFDIDVEEEDRAVNVETSREALKQGLFAFMQSSGQIASQGGDALPIIKLGVNTIQNLEHGMSVEDAIQSAYEIMQQEQQAAQEAAAQQQAQQAGPGAPGGAPGGLGSPLPPGVAPGQAGQPAGGTQTIEQMVSGFRGGGTTPVMSNEIRRRVATGGP